MMTLDGFRCLSVRSASCVDNRSHFGFAEIWVRKYSNIDILLFSLKSIVLRDPQYSTKRHLIPCAYHVRMPAMQFRW